MNSDDHDLLIQIDTKMDRVLSDTAEVRNDIYGKDGIRERVQKIEVTATTTFRNLAIFAGVISLAVSVIIALVEHFC